MDSNPFDSSLVLSFADAVTTGKKGKQHKPRAAGKHTGDQAQINVLEPRILLANVISAVDPGIGGTTPFTRPGFIGINIANNLISPGTVTIQDDDAQIGPFITWNTDFDTGGFVTQAVMDVLEAAGNTITSGLMDTLDAIAPSGINTWTASFTHPGTGVNQQIVDLPVAENEYIIYVGGRNLGGSVSQSQPGSFAALSGNTQAFFDSVTNRGELGEDDDPPTDYADWGGSISFNDTQGFYHIGETTSGLDPGEFDLFTVAAQAVMRIFGFGGFFLPDNSFDRFVNQDNEFTGPSALEQFDFTGGIPLNGDFLHQDVTDNMQPVLMNPFLPTGVRIGVTDLEKAVLKDMGWEVIQAGGGTEINMGDAMGNEGDSVDGDSTLTFTISVNQPPAQDLTVQVITEHHTARSDEEMTGSPDGDFDDIGTITATIGAGNTTTTVEVVVHGDDRPENDETLHVKLMNPSAGTIADAVGEGMIINDDGGFDRPSFVIDYSLDTNNFFDTQDKRDVLQSAGKTILDRVGDDLIAILPGKAGFGDNSWKAQFTGPGSGVSEQVANLSVAANEIHVFAGGRSLSGSTLGQGGPGGFADLNIGTDFETIVKERGQAGVANDTDTAPWGGAITFDDAGTTFFFDNDLIVLGDVPQNEHDFFSVAVHELLHLLGIGTAASWDALIDQGNNVFRGVKAAAIFGSNVPVDTGGSMPFGHFAQGTVSPTQGQEAVMVPSVAAGMRRFFTDLDFAALDDIGYEEFANFELVTIAGVKFEDLDGDGVEDQGEPGLEGWTIQLQDGNGQLITTATTDVNGDYSFADVGPGTHRIREVLQPGWTQTSTDPSDIVTTSGGDVSDIDFGNFELVTIAGVKFEDEDGDGVKDQGEPGLEGWTIQLQDGNGQLITTATTDVNGDYGFDDLGPGTYRVREVLQQGWTQTTADPDDVTVVSGDDVSGVNFGNGNFELALDVDGNSAPAALTDGLLIMRYLAGFRGQALISGAVAPDATRTTAEEIEAFFEETIPAYGDVDDSGSALALTDGLLILRFLAGFTGAALIADAIGAGATRTDAGEIADFLRQFDPTGSLLLKAGDAGQTREAAPPQEPGLQPEVTASSVSEPVIESLTQTRPGVFGLLARAYLSDAADVAPVRLPARTASVFDQLAPTGADVSAPAGRFTRVSAERFDRFFTTRLHEQGTDLGLAVSPREPGGAGPDNLGAGGGLPISIDWDAPASGQRHTNELATADRTAPISRDAAVLERLDAQALSDDHTPVLGRLPWNDWSPAAVLARPEQVPQAR